jgi:hypothetical protein
MIIYIVKSNFWNKHKLIYMFGCDYAVTLPHSGALGPQFTCSSSFLIRLFGCDGRPYCNPPTPWGGAPLQFWYVQLESPQ